MYQLRKETRKKDVIGIAKRKRGDKGEKKGPAKGRKSIAYSTRNSTTLKITQLDGVWDKSNGKKSEGKSGEEEESEASSTDSKQKMKEFYKKLMENDQIEGGIKPQKSSGKSSEKKNPLKFYKSY